MGNGTSAFEACNVAKAILSIIGEPKNFFELVAKKVKRISTDDDEEEGEDSYDDRIREEDEKKFVRESYPEFLDEEELQ
jgi:hypothetical protein